MELEQIKPVGEVCLLLPAEAATKSTAGLVMENSSNAAAAPVLGDIISAGDKSRFKKGQQVLYTRYSTFKCVIITPDGEKEFTLVNDEDILAIVQPKITKTKIKSDADGASKKG